MAALTDSSSTSPLPAGSSSLYVGKLHPDVTEAQLFDAFSEFESLLSVRLCLKSVGGYSIRYGYVSFASHHDAAMAIKAKNHSKFNGNPILVTWSSFETGNLPATQPSGQSKYVPSLAINARIASWEVKCRPTTGTLRRMLKHCTPEDHTTMLKMHLDAAVENLKLDFSADTCAKVTAKIFEMDSEEVLGLLDTPERLAAKVDEVVKVLGLADEPPVPRFIDIDLPASYTQYV